MSSDKLIYPPLTRPDGIRVLEIWPATSEEEINCSLQEAFLDSSVDFSALSYTWGDVADTLPVTVIHQTLAVTRNVFSALKRIRTETSPVRIWIDAISVNQEDFAERELQVRLMR
jgi:hypothetical protein